MENKLSALRNSKPMMPLSVNFKKEKPQGGMISLISNEAIEDSSLLNLGLNYTEKLNKRVLIVSQKSNLEGIKRGFSRISSTHLKEFEGYSQGMGKLYQLEEKTLFVYLLPHLRIQSIDFILREIQTLQEILNSELILLTRFEDESLERFQGDSSKEKVFLHSHLSLLKTIKGFSIENSCRVYKMIPFIPKNHDSLDYHIGLKYLFDDRLIC